MPGWEDFVGENQGRNNLIEQFITSKDSTSNPGDGVILIPGDKKPEKEEELEEPIEVIDPDPTPVEPTPKEPEEPKEPDDEKEIVVVKKVVTIYIDDNTTEENDAKIAKNVLVISAFTVAAGITFLIVYLSVRLCRQRKQDRKIMVVKPVQTQPELEIKVKDDDAILEIDGDVSDQYNPRPTTDLNFMTDQRKSQRRVIVGGMRGPDYEGDVESNVFSGPNLFTETSRRNDLNTS